MTRKYIKKNLEYWDSKGSGKNSDSEDGDAESCSGDVANSGKPQQYKSEGEMDTTTPVLKKKLGRPRKVEGETSNQTVKNLEFWNAKGSGKNSDSEDGDAEFCSGDVANSGKPQQYKSEGEMDTTTPVLKKKLGRPRKVEGETSNQTVKNLAFWNAKGSAKNSDSEDGDAEFCSGDVANSGKPQQYKSEGERNLGDLERWKEKHPIKL
ncbi:hypothetical protein EGW08_015947 [Elysia chlorotica]|uniref:Uncharacterized protein n=1 Tax=Elysia chlorotica TaxID=188477 RepID=A0A3S1B553_ELYCH|nr:hypothetical protein EGW08_015947 [Elysia chlorotica]